MYDTVSESSLQVAPAAVWLPLMLVLAAKFRAADAWKDAEPEEEEAGSATVTELGVAPRVERVNGALAPVAV